MSEVSFDDIRPLFGKTLLDPTTQAFFARFPAHRIGKPAGGTQYVVFRESGFDLAYSRLLGPSGEPLTKSRVMTTAFLYRRGKDGHEEFLAPPFGVAFADAHEQLVAKLGAPFAASTAAPSKFLASVGMTGWAKLVVGEWTIHASYELEGMTSTFTLSPAS